jgi:hypothetical protein
LLEREERQLEAQFERALAWLDLKHYHQEDALENLIEKCYGHTADWFLSHRKVTAWSADRGQGGSLWVHGIPGSGKQNPEGSSNMKAVFLI